jgi:hypothetical protein
MNDLEKLEQLIKQYSMSKDNLNLFLLLQIAKEINYLMGEVNELRKLIDRK